MFNFKGRKTLQWYTTDHMQWYNGQKNLPRCSNMACLMERRVSFLKTGFSYRLSIYPLHTLHRSDFVGSMVQLQPGLHEPNRICQCACHETWKMNLCVFNPSSMWRKRGGIVCVAYCDCLGSLVNLLVF